MRKFNTYVQQINILEIFDTIKFIAYFSNLMYFNVYHKRWKNDVIIHAFSFLSILKISILFYMELSVQHVLTECEVSEETCIKVAIKINLVIKKQGNH